MPLTFKKIKKYILLFLKWKHTFIMKKGKHVKHAMDILSDGLKMHFGVTQYMGSMVLAAHKFKAD